MVNLVIWALNQFKLKLSDCIEMYNSKTKHYLVTIIEHSGAFESIMG